MKTQRKLNIEVLRVMAMFLIVMGHYWYNTVKEVPACNAYTIDRAGEYLVSQALFSFSAIGVNCFVMITGYFLIRSRKFRYGGAIRVSVQTLFYSLLACLVLLCFPEHGVPSPSDWLIALEPMPLHHHWFIAKYMALLAVAPFLAILAARLSRKQYAVLMLLLFALLFQYPLGDFFGGGMSLGWFVFLFFTGGYFRLYPPKAGFRKSAAAAGGILAAITALHAIPGLAACLTSGSPLALKLDGNHSVTYFLSCAVFLCFSNREMTGKAARAVSRLAPLTLGIYLIHEHWLVRDLLWRDIVPALQDKPGITACIYATAAIFAACALLDSLRRAAFRFCGIEEGIRRLADRLPQPLESEGGEQ